MPTRGKEKNWIKPKKVGRLKERFQQAASKKKKKKKKKKKTAPRKSLVPDYLFTLIFQQAEENWQYNTSQGSKWKKMDCELRLTVA